VLSCFDYPNRDDTVVGQVDPLIVGPPSTVYESGESPSAKATTRHG
jgi:hypothetical protein